MKKVIEWLKWRPENGSVPNWAWCITWGIMALAIVMEITALLLAMLS